MPAPSYIPTYTIADYLKWPGDWELNFAELALVQTASLHHGRRDWEHGLCKEHIAPLTEARKLKRLRAPSPIPQVSFAIAH